MLSFVLDRELTVKFRPDLAVRVDRSQSEVALMTFDEMKSASVGEIVQSLSLIRASKVMNTQRPAFNIQHTKK